MPRGRCPIALLLLILAATGGGLAAGAVWGATWQGAAAVLVEVHDEKGQPVPAARVTARLGEGQEGPGPAWTDAKGRVLLAGLAEGEWYVEVAHDAYMLYAAYLQVRAGKKPEVGFSSQVNTATSFKPLAVRFTRPTPESARGLTGERRAEAGEPSALPAPPGPPVARTEEEAIGDVARRPAPVLPPAEPPTAPPAAAEPVAGPAWAGDSTPALSAPGPVAAPEAPATPAPAAGPAPGTAVEPQAPDASLQAPGPAPVRLSPGPPPLPAKPATPAPSPAAPTPAQTLAPTAPTVTPSPPPVSPAAVPTPAPTPAQTLAPTAPTIAPSPPPVSPAAAPTPAPIPAPTRAPAIPPPTPTSSPTALAPAAATPGPLPDYLGTAAAGNCPGCKSGEWAVIAQEIVRRRDFRVNVSVQCPGEVAGVAAAAGRLATAAGDSLAPYAGPLALVLAGGHPSALDAATRQAVAADLGPLGAAASECRAVGVLLPAGAGFAGYQYEAWDALGGGGCLADRDCPLGQARWHGEPRAVEAGRSTLVYGVFQNRSTRLERRAKLTVFFVPPAEWRR